MITGELKNRIDSLWDVFAAGGLVNPLDVIEQITYLMFIRDLDDSDNLRAKESMMLGIPYKSIFEGEVSIGERKVDGSQLIPLSSEDIKALEKILWSEVGTKEDYEAEFGEKPLGEFVREIVGLDMSAAKEAFAKYLNDVNLDSRQIYFVNQIVEYIVHNGLMKDLSVLQESPFTDKGSIVEVFTDLTVWMGIRKAIEQINANALVA